MSVNPSSRTRPARLDLQRWISSARPLGSSPAFIESWRAPGSGAERVTPVAPRPHHEMAHDAGQDEFRYIAQQIDAATHTQSIDREQVLRRWLIAYAASE
jgi:hypothetical protein